MTTPTLSTQLAPRPFTGIHRASKRGPWLSSSGRLTWIVRSARALNGPRWLALVLLVPGLSRGWLQPALSAPLRATDINVTVPGMPGPQVSWGLLLAVGLMLALVGITPWGNRRPAWTMAAALLTVFATLGFLLQSCLMDVALQQRLQRDESDLLALQRLMGYQIPRPHLTTLGPVPLPGPTADVFSGLRSGFYLALIGAVLLAAGAATRRSRLGSVAGRRGRPAVVLLAAAIVVLLSAGVADSAVDTRALSGARAAAAAGDDKAAVAQFRRALGHRIGADSRPNTAAEYGTALLRIGSNAGPEAQLAASRLQRDAGRDLAALQTVAAASDHWPANAALRDEFTMQAFDYLRRHEVSQAVHRLLPRNADSALLRVTLAKYDLSTGDDQTAMTDARAAESLTTDADMRSVALTFLAVGQTRSGDLIGGRRTLLAAVDADTSFVNVMARSLLAGLYTTLPL